MSMQAYSDDAFDFLNGPSETRSSAQASMGHGPGEGASLLGVELPDDLQARVEAMRQAQNPLLEAAQPLLRMLAEVPASFDSSAEIEALRELLVREVVVFQKLCDRANLPWKHMVAARYCLCTALDEAANRTQWGKGGVWAVKSLLITFEGEVDGGEKFFLLIGRMATDPQAYVDVLEVLYRILGLGFEGRYSVIVDGRRHLDQIRQRLLTLINSARDAVPLALSPHWHGTAPGKLRLFGGVSAKATACAAALLVSALFGWDKYRLLSQSALVEAKIRAAGDVIHVAPQRLRLAYLLRNEIAKGLVSVEEDAVHSLVIFKGDTMFVSGQSRVRPEMNDILARVGREVARVEGMVTVTGHTDNQPVHTAEFPDNQVLSEKRAQFVADVLKANGTQPDRIHVVGKGDTEPLADNASEQGRARNRRVEVLVTL
ncbi:type VI secretion system protein TssL, long form [Dyella sp.]|uniref:type VI secretion system protein TssL, long form n=1 Tax=Dyella sp. TaxID=1869338 RepID=UPI002B4A6F52|nr:type VI secretion system protein TssL, long form [Dyella sp.]HKT27463.1 type VI secretion system protein TssL, long form [Dyella sp.]